MKSLESDGEMTKQGDMTKKIVASTFGALLAVSLVSAATARADTTDADFTQYLESHGIHLGTTSQTVNMAHVMCQDLDAGYTQADEVKQLTDANRLNEAQAKLFVGAATADYCPNKHPASKPS
jgi:Protein of unknown function (DUF732)